MPLRMLEIFVPTEAQPDIDALVDEIDVVDCWQESVMDDRHLVRVLVAAESVEAVLDRMEARFSQYASFRAVIVSVVATIPPLPEPEKTKDLEEPKEKLAAEKKKVRERVARDELLENIKPGTRVTPVYLATICLSTVVVGVGLYRDNTAALVGGMVIAPLLTPNIALALATTLGDWELARRAVRTNLIGMAVAFALAVVVGFFVPDSFAPGAEFAARTHPDVSDTILALAAGAAGVLACTTGVSASLVGVMVAVALLPPLLVAGISLGAGRFSDALGAAMLLAANIICLNLAAVATFLFQGVHPRTWWESDKAKRATRGALLLWGGLALVLLFLLARFWTEF